METAEIQASLQSPLFSRLVEDGEYLFEVFESPVTLHFFPLCVLKRCPPPPPTLYFEPKPILSKTLKGLLMRPVIFENTFFHALGSKVNGKERSRPSLFVCFFVPPC